MKAPGTPRGLSALLLPLVLLLGVSLTACGGDSDSTATDPGTADSSSTSTPTASESTEPTETAEPSESATPTPDWPACSDVWVADAKLPGGYKGCLEGDDVQKADTLSCSSGQRIVRYADRFYGVAGGTIHETSGPLDKDKGYLKTIRTCRA